ncbi:Hypothetical_protein [Hexamita inflata]|uniref:Hypothetical_protein n=1 Tax=Hexamita inflata TaxID=28002 RepID=A0ABP1GGX1_9EUKA
MYIVNEQPNIFTSLLEFAFMFGPQLAFTTKREPVVHYLASTTVELHSQLERVIELPWRNKDQNLQQQLQLQYQCRNEHDDQYGENDELCCGQCDRMVDLYENVQCVSDQLKCDAQLQYGDALQCDAQHLNDDDHRQSDDVRLRVRDPL